MRPSAPIVVLDSVRTAILDRRREFAGRTPAPRAGGRLAAEALLTADAEDRSQ
jgi:hypothetical protein